MSRLDESDIIMIIQKALGNSRFTPKDVELFDIDGIKIAVNVDTLVQSTDMPSKMKIRDAARKSIAACVSDFASKGIKPLYGVVSLNLPKNVSVLQVKHIARGIKEASDEFGIKILGGDTNRGIEFVFHVCIFGKAKKTIERGGAEPGDLVFVTGPFGYAAAGLEILMGEKRARSIFRRDAVRSFARPRPRLNFGLKSGKYFTSSMDSSDGLSATLNEMAAQSRCSFVIDGNPAGKGLDRFAKTNNISAERLIFDGGEEYEFVFTAKERHKSAIQKNALLTDTPVMEIGRVKSGNGVFLKKDELLERIRGMGWRHFK